MTTDLPPSRDLRRALAARRRPARRPPVPRVPQRGRRDRHVDLRRVRRPRPRHHGAARGARRRPRGRGAPVPAQLPRVHRALARHHGARGLDGARRPGVDEPGRRDPDRPGGPEDGLLREVAEGHLPRRHGGCAAAEHRPRGDRRGRATRRTPAGRGRPDRRGGGRGAGHPARRHVHLGHDVAAQGRRADPGQLPPRRRGHGGRRGPRRRRPVAGHPAAVPRERAVLLLRPGDRGRRLRRPDRDVLGEPVGRHGDRARRHPRQPVRRARCA